MSDLYKFGYTLDETIKTMRDVIDTGSHDKMFLDTYYWLKMLSEYREIGTVEECREAAEKQKPKKPKDRLKINPVIDCNGAYIDADTTVYLLCPSCGEAVGIDENVDKFCRECGQAIDENLEGMEDE